MNAMSITHICDSDNRFSIGRVNGGSEKTRRYGVLFNDTSNLRRFIRIEFVNIIEIDHTNYIINFACPPI